MSIFKTGPHLLTPEKSPKYKYDFILYLVIGASLLFGILKLKFTELFDDDELIFSILDGAVGIFINIL